MNPEKEMPSKKNAQSAAELYESVWSQNRYQGFSKGTVGASSTPMLEDFIQEIKKLNTQNPSVLELGAGSGSHSLRLASERFKVTAVESSRTAVEGIKESLKNFDGTMNVVQQSLFDYVSHADPNTFAGVYANAVFHFLSTSERKKIYHDLYRIQISNGILAISFKGEGDSLQKRGQEVESHPSGKIIQGDDQVKRLFVTHPESLQQEMKEAGYEPFKVMKWSIPDYNIQGEPGVFVGLMARRKS